MKCDWCESEDIEQVGTEYNGWPIMHCKRCSHEFPVKVVNEDTRR